MRIRIKIRKAAKRRSTSNARWLATGTLLAYSALGGGRPALAQQKGAASGASPAAGTLVVHTFDIPAGPLEQVIRAFEASTGFHVDARQPGIWTVNSPGVSGVFTVDKGLKQLLSGTGVVSRTLTPESVLLELATVATTVEVTADAAALSTSTVKYSEPLLDTPQTINTVSQEVMKQQGTTTLRDALRNVAGISLAAGEGGVQGDNLTIRGFSARNDLFIDGMRDFGSYYRDPFNTEEVQVLQGPSSVTFGRGSTGGVVNQSTKFPGMSRFIHAEGDFGTDQTRRGTADINIPLGRRNTSPAFRVNLMGDQAHVAGRDIAENRRFGVAPSLSFGQGTPTRWNFSYFHQGANDIPDYGVPWFFNGPAQVNRRNFYGFKDGNFLDTAADIGTVRYEHEINDRVTVRNQVRYANYARDARITEARLPTTATPATPLSQITLTRNQLAVNSAETNLVDQLDLTAKVQTGVLQHSLVGGVEAGRETSDPTRYAWTNVPGTSLLNPNPNQTFSGTSTVSSVVNTTARSAAAYILDTLKLGKKWELSGGVRWDRFSANYKQTVGAIASFQRVDRMASWRSALVYKPAASSSLYVSVGNSFNPSAESLALSATTANLPPEENRTYEAGAKWDLQGNRLSLRTAVFRTEKLNAREPDPNNATQNVLAGTQKVIGQQFEIRGKLTNRWDMLASYAHLDATLASSRFYTTAIGARLANVPENTFNFWSNMRLPSRWQLGAGGNFASSRTASSTVPLDPATGLLKQVPGYWVFNAMASRRINEHVELQANVYNLANRYYYDLLHPGHLVLGAGRSALIGLKFRF